MNGYLKAVIGLVIGAITTGVWFSVDLFTPEPIGDYLLYSLMGLSNMVVGWQVGRLLGKSRQAVKNESAASAVKGLKSN